jgi:hypothetical protein
VRDAARARKWWTSGGILVTIAKRRHGDHKRAETEVQIFAERPGIHRGT